MTIDRFFVDVSNQQLLISFTLDADDSVHKYGLSDIYIDFTDTFVCANDPSDNAIKIEAADLEDWIMKDNDPAVSGITDISQLTQIKVENFPVSFDNVLSYEPENELYFLWVYETDSESGDTAAIKYSPTFAVAFSVVTLYNYILSILKNIKSNTCNKCSTDCNTVVPMLLYEGFLRAFDLKNYKKVVEYWKLLHQNYNSNSKTCDCNG